MRGRTHSERLVQCSHNGWRLKPRLRAAPQSPPSRAAERAPTGHPVGSVPGNLRRQVLWPTSEALQARFQPPALPLALC